LYNNPAVKFETENAMLRFKVSLYKSWKITIFDTTKSVWDWAYDPNCEVSPSEFLRRIEDHWEPEEAFLYQAPVRHHSEFSFDQE